MAESGAVVASKNLDKEVAECETGSSPVSTLKEDMEQRENVWFKPQQEQQPQPGL